MFIVSGAEPNLRYPDLDPQAIRDANLLEETMAGMGTNDALLVMRWVLVSHVSLIFCVWSTFTDVFFVF